MHKICIIHSSVEGHLSCFHSQRGTNGQNTDKKGGSLNKYSYNVIFTTEAVGKSWKMERKDYKTQRNKTPTIT